MSPIRDEAGTVIGASTIARDVSARKALEARRLQGQKMETLGRLTGGVAHDFANMLAVVTTSLHLFRSQNAGRLPMDDIEAALASAESGRKLTQRLLSFARRLPTDPVMIDLSDHVGRNIRWIQNVLGEDIEMVKCETIDMEVPAHAEVVIEGFVHPSDRIQEGPFGEFTGYGSGAEGPAPGSASVPSWETARDAAPCG